MPSYYSGLRKERYYSDIMKDQLEKIKNESDYRAKVDLAVDTLILVYNEQDRLRKYPYNDPHIANLSCEGYKQVMADIFQFGWDEEKKVCDALELTDSKKRTWLCEMAKEKMATTWPSFISTAKWKWKHVSAFGKFWNINEI